MKRLLRFDWGTKVFVLYTAFASMIIFFVYKSMNQKIDLVSPDYYAQELKFQDKLDMINRAKALPTQVKWELSEEKININFPKELGAVEGDILFFRPSDKKKDYKTPLSPDEAGYQEIDVHSLSKGLYRMQITWTANNEKYFSEDVIVIK